MKKDFHDYEEVCSVCPFRTYTSKSNLRGMIFLGGKYFADELMILGATL